jgi:hypothetical protein
MDDVLIGRASAVDTSHFYGVAAGGANEAKALGCIRYIIEKVLHWSPEEAIRKFDAYIIRITKLESLISKIQYPVEVPAGNPKYILSLLYPSLVHIDQRTLVEQTFAEVLEAGRRNPSGEEKEDGKSLKQFPRDYFSGGEGFTRFCHCIVYLIDNIKPMDSVEEIYRFFDSPDGKKMLYNYRLKVPADQFSINMLDVIRSITSEEPDSELFYSFFTFQKEIENLS